jgi:hypothetical protein
MFAMGDHLPPSDEGEIWKDVPGYEGLYQVSNQGRVWSVPRRVWISSSARNHGCWRKAGGQIRAQSTGTNGYMLVRLYHASVANTWSVHQLVLLAFVGEPPAGEECCHGPAGQKVNWWPENLRYDTKPSNNADRQQHGTLAAGETHGRAKLTKADVIEIRRLYDGERAAPRSGRTWTHKALAQRYHVSPSTIRAVIQGRNWQGLAA